MENEMNDYLTKLGYRPFPVDFGRKHAESVWQRLLSKAKTEDGERLYSTLYVYHHENYVSVEICSQIRMTDGTAMDVNLFGIPGVELQTRLPGIEAIILKIWEEYSK